MKKLAISIFLVLLAVCLFVGCSSSPKEEVSRAQISEPITITSITDDQGNPATLGINGYETYNDYFHGIITLTLPEGLSFAVSLNDGDTVDASWYDYVNLTGSEDLSQTIKVKNNVYVGDTEIKFEIYKTYPGAFSGKYTFTFPNSVFNADYVGESPEFQFHFSRAI